MGETLPVQTDIDVVKLQDANLKSGMSLGLPGVAKHSARILIQELEVLKLPLSVTNTLEL